MTKYPKFKKPYDIPNHLTQTFSSVSKTQQQFTHDADIYTIINKHTRGIPYKINGQEPIFTDVSQIDYSNNHLKIQELKNKLNEQEKELAQKMDLDEIEKLEKRLKSIKEKNDKNEKPAETTT